MFQKKKNTSNKICQSIRVIQTIKFAYTLHTQHFRIVFGAECVYFILLLLLILQPKQISGPGPTFTFFFSLFAV